MFTLCIVDLSDNFEVQIPCKDEETVTRCMNCIEFMNYPYEGKFEVYILDMNGNRTEGLFWNV